MKENGLKIGLEDEARVGHCGDCRHCCYVQKLLHKVWLCYIRKDEGENAVRGKLRVRPSSDKCGYFEKRYSKPSTLSKRKLMQYGIIKYAFSEGYRYVDANDIEKFGCCKDCAHYSAADRLHAEACKLRGKGDGFRSSEWCCRSFVPRSPKYYIELCEC